MAELSRRGFFGSVAAFAAACTLDPELLLWKPGEKTIFLPPLKGSLIAGKPLLKGDIFTIEGIYAVNPVTFKTMDWLQHFVITSDVSSGEVSTENICPSMVFNGVYTNVSGVLAPKSRITPLEYSPALIRRLGGAQ